MMVFHQEASADSSQRCQLCPVSNLEDHGQTFSEEVKLVQMTGDDTEVNVMEPKLWSLPEMSCKYRHLVLQESKIQCSTKSLGLSCYFQL